MTSQDIVSLLKKEHGIDVKSASSTIEEVVGRQIVERLARQRNISLPTGDMFAETPVVKGKKGGAPTRKPAEPPKAAAPALPPPRLVKMVKPVAPVEAEIEAPVEPEPAPIAEAPAPEVVAQAPAAVVHAAPDDAARWASASAVAARPHAAARHAAASRAAVSPPSGYAVPSVVPGAAWRYRAPSGGSAARARAAGAAADGPGTAA